MEDKFATVRQIGRTINTLELRGADTFERSVALLTNVLAAKKRHSLGPDFAVEALSKAAAASAAFAEGNRLLVDCHRHLAADQIDFGVPRLGGDLCPLPNVVTGSTDAPKRPAFSLVA